MLSYLHHDHLGSTKVFSGTTGGPMKYYPFGSTYQEIASPPTDNLYTGQKRDASTGLYFYGARYYHVGSGTFTQPDSIVPNPGNPQSLNRYSYTLNNPLKYTDPTGHREIDLDDEGTYLNPARPLPSTPHPAGTPANVHDPAGRQGTIRPDPVTEEPDSTAPAYVDGGDICLFVDSPAGPPADSRDTRAVAQPTRQLPVEPRRSRAGRQYREPKGYYTPSAKEYLTKSRRSAAVIGQPSLDPEMDKTMVMQLNKPSVATRRAVMFANAWSGTAGVPGNQELVVSAVESAAAVKGVKSPRIVVIVTGADIMAQGVSIVGPGLADTFESLGM